MKIYKKPTIKISDNQIYEINTSKRVRKILNKEIKKMNKMKNLKDVLRATDEMLPLLLGEKAANEIKEMDLSLDSTISILIAIEAALGNKSYKIINEKYR